MAKEPYCLQKLMPKNLNAEKPVLLAKKVIQVAFSDAAKVKQHMSTIHHLWSDDE